MPHHLHFVAILAILAVMLIPTFAQVNCIGSFYSGPCSVTCGGGELALTYRIITPNDASGKPCDFANGTVQTTSCNPDPCPAPYKGPIQAAKQPEQDSVATIVIPVVIPICAILVCGAMVLARYMRREKQVNDAIENGVPIPEEHGGWFW